MKVNVDRIVWSDPLFPSSMLLSLSDPGGMSFTTANTPGSLRPFAATLGVPRPVLAKKHDTTSTSHSQPTNSQTHKDGGYVNDSVTDTSVDS